MNRKKLIWLSLICVSFLLFANLYFIVGDTYARYVSQFSRDISYSAESLPLFYVDQQVATSSCVLKPSADAWIESGGEQVFSFTLSHEGADRKTFLCVRVFIPELDGAAQVPSNVALTVGNSRYVAESDYLVNNTPFGMEHNTNGWYYCFVVNEEEILCQLDDVVVSQNLVVSIQKTQITDFSRIWICIDQVDS